MTGEIAVAVGTGGILCSMSARTLARAGTTIALLDINLEAAEETVRGIRGAGGMAVAYGVDAMDKEMLESAHARMLTQLGPCGVLTDGVGGNQARANTSKEYFGMGGIEVDVVTLFDMEYKGVRDVLGLNFLGRLLTCQVFAKDVVGREGCNIINISSASAARPLTGIPIYSGAMTAPSNSTQQLAVHFAKAEIHINAIAPGFLVTRQGEGLLYDEDGKLATRTAKVLATTPMGRFGKPEELGGALAFLLNNEAAGFVIGIILLADGGLSVYSGM